MKYLEESNSYRHKGECWLPGTEKGRPGSQCLMEFRCQSGMRKSCGNGCTVLWMYQCHRAVTEKLLKWKNLCYALFYHNIDTHAWAHKQSCPWSKYAAFMSHSYTRFCTTKTLIFFLEKVAYLHQLWTPFYCPEVVVCGYAHFRSQTLILDRRRQRGDPRTWAHMTETSTALGHSPCFPQEITSILGAMEPRWAPCPLGKHPNSEMVSRGLVVNIRKKLKLYTLKQGYRRANISWCSHQLLTEEGVEGPDGYVTDSSSYTFISCPYTRSYACLQAQALTCLAYYKPLGSNAFPNELE